jgi:hypothetical protein
MTGLRQTADEQGSSTEQFVNKPGPSDRVRSSKSDRSPVASLSKAWVCVCSLAGIAGSNAAGDIAVCLL